MHKGLLEFEKISNLNYNSTFDIKDFDTSFVKNLSIKDGAATLTEYTSIILSMSLHIDAWDFTGYGPLKTVLITGGGRKNKFLINRIKKLRRRQARWAIKNEHDKIAIKSIDEYRDKYGIHCPNGIDGDFVESQAFGYLAIRSFLKLPISFPNTTGCRKPCTGGVIVKNF